MHAAGMASAAIPIDRPLEDGALLWGAVRVVHLPGIYYPEEVALLVETDRPAPFLIVGDALSGGREDQGIPDGEVALHAPGLVSDFSRARASLARLLDLQFDAIGFGHGTPVLTGGRAAVERCLRSEVAWLASGGRKGNLTRLASWPSRTLFNRFLDSTAERVAQEGG
jgi:glyoxylase-like metal-dependent hydrolase (beta-lactamase superfamily II)